ncbi:MAG: integrase, partial [Pseudomonadota bacterium]|nr:integrase [Pseudomonadota bacterium]
MADLSKIGERDALRSRKGDEPHWQRLRHGCYVGFRPSKRGGRGTWFARAYDPDKCKYSRKALGDYG